VSEPLPMANFLCKFCGAPCTLADEHGESVCPACCSDHDYRYDADYRTHYCFTCGQEPPSDWYGDWDDNV
jgi:hypothetical protein